MQLRFRYVSLLLVILTLALSAYSQPTATIGVQPASSTARPSQTSASAVGFTTIGGFGGPIEVFSVSNNLAYVGEGAVFTIVDVSDPAHPLQRGAVALERNISALQLSGGLAYVADSVESAGLSYSALEIIDVTNPDNPAARGSFVVTGVIEGFQVAGMLAYLATSGGLQIVDVSDPAAPRLRGQYGTPGAANEVQVAGSLAYIATANSGLQIVDVSNPDSPVLRASYSTA